MQKKDKKQLVLYISYDGMLEPLGQSQVIQYLKGLARTFEIILISYEKELDWNDKNKMNTVRRELSQNGIYWRPLRYHKRPSTLATTFDIVLGFLISSWLLLTKPIRVVHARSYVPSVIALALKKIFNTKFIFDMRGFWADERVDGGLWHKHSKKYKIAKWFEKEFLQRADVVVSLTNSAVEPLKKLYYNTEKEYVIKVIPTCVNLEIFTPKDSAWLRKKLDIGERFVVGYVGSVGTWYLFDEVIECFKAIKGIVSNAVLLILNRNEHKIIKSKLFTSGILPDDYRIIHVNYSEIAWYISLMNCGVFFYKPVYSKLATSPTKFAEFLACGVPVIANDIGDVGRILKPDIGILINDLSEDEYKRAAVTILDLIKNKNTPQACRKAAETFFSLKKGLHMYSEIYRSLLK